MSHCYLVTQLAETKEVLAHQVSSDVHNVCIYLNGLIGRLSPVHFSNDDQLQIELEDKRKQRQQAAIDWIDKEIRKVSKQTERKQK